MGSRRRSIAIRGTGRSANHHPFPRILTNSPEYRRRPSRFALGFLPPISILAASILVIISLIPTGRPSSVMNSRATRSVSMTAGDFGAPAFSAGPDDLCWPVWAPRDISYRRIKSSHPDASRLAASRRSMASVRIEICLVRHGKPDIPHTQEKHKRTSYGTRKKCTIQYAQVLHPTDQPISRDDLRTRRR